MRPQFTEITEPAITALVDQFYTRVRRHPVLGPVFNTAIAPDAWPPHLEKMYAFWSSVMLTSGRYKGNPVGVHREVASITPPLFSTWLELFEVTAADMFIPPLAERFIRSAQRIAESLKLALFFRPDQPWPQDLRQPGTRACA